MIAKMKKASLIVRNKDLRVAVEELKKIGLMHVSGTPTTSDELSEAADRYHKLLRAKNVAMEIKGVKADYKTLMDETAVHEYVKRILAVSESIKQSREEVIHLNQEKDTLLLWGDSLPGTIAELSDKNILVTLHELNKKQLTEARMNFRVFVCGSKKSISLCAIVREAHEKTPEYNQIVLPDTCIADLETRITEKKLLLDSLNSELKQLASHRHLLDKIIPKTEADLEFVTVFNSAEHSGDFSVVEGFLPEKKQKLYGQKAAELGWGCTLRDVTADDVVPTLIDNPKPLKLLEPISGFLNLYPGYFEKDVTSVFLGFFLIFFAMIIGDGAYGTLFLILGLFGLWINRGKPFEKKKAFYLLSILSAITAAWGAVTGTWFGSQTLTESTFLKNLVIPALYSFDPKSGDLVKWICFILGTAQMMIAHLWAFLSQIRQKPRLKAFAQIGWLLVMFAVYNLVMFMIVDPSKFPFLQYNLPVFGLGFAMIVIFGKQDGKFFKGILESFKDLLPLVLGQVSAFSDLISYIRLFAVGLASLEIAKAVNMLASGAPFPFGILILLLGHGINIAMSLLSVLVHGVRLNILEFAGHLGIEWSGIPYKPFAEKNKAE